MRFIPLFLSSLISCVFFSSCSTSSTPSPASESSSTAQVSPSQVGPVAATVTTIECGTASPTADVDAGDLDGDGDQDLVLISYMGGGQVVIHGLFNDGSGSYSRRELARLPWLATSNIRTDPRTVVLTDTEGDGDLDIVVGGLTPPADGFTISLFRNNGRGNFDSSS